MAKKIIQGDLQTNGDLQVEYITNQDEKTIKIKAGGVTIIVPYISAGGYIAVKDLPVEEQAYDSTQTYYRFIANEYVVYVPTESQLSRWSSLVSAGRVYIYQAGEVKSIIQSRDGANFEILAGNTKVVVPYSSVGSYVSCAEMTYDSTATYYVYENDEYVAYDGEMTERYFNENKASLYIYQANPTTYQIQFPTKNGTVATTDDVVANPVLAGTESDLTGIEINGVKYKAGGGGELYEHIVSFSLGSDLQEGYTSTDWANRVYVTIYNNSSEAINTRAKLRNALHNPNKIFTTNFARVTDSSSNIYYVAYFVCDSNRLRVYLSNNDYIYSYTEFFSDTITKLL